MSTNNERNGSASNSRGLGTALVIGLALFAVGFWFGRSTATTVAVNGAPVTDKPEASLTRNYGLAGSGQARGATEANAARDETDAHSLRAKLAQLSQEPPSASRDERMQETLRQLAVDDPQAALRLAEGQTNLKTRQRYLLAALEGWGSSDPAAAIEWIQDWPTRRREEAYARIANGAAATDPGGLAKLGQKAIGQGTLSRERGFALVKALARQGAFELAANFTRNATTDTPAGAAWAMVAYQSWAEYQPEEAATHALQLEEADQARSAFHAVAMGWAQAEPEGLAAFAQQLPNGRERSYALGEALRQWVEREPLAAADWIDQVEPSPDLDVGVLALATNPYLGENRPEIAASWAESLFDAHLRSDTLARIVHQWAASDKKSAYRYVQTSQAFPPDTREDLLTLLAPN